MLSNIKYIGFLVLVCEILFVCICIFSRGFLLTRNEVAGKSLCHDFNGTHRSEGDSGGCWMPKKFPKAILMIIDGLWYDFATYDASLGSSARIYQNNMMTFHELLSSGHQNAVLKPFIADAPTTTMQRLKGLTTGSLPTFIDAGFNFASEEIAEDNVIDQLKSQGAKIVALGDDTWGNLFPNRFHRSFLFNSFNVKDLDTVDNGILAQMMSEIRKPDWDLMILHFLGLDHVGHTHGLDHPKMKEKLLQMDRVVSDLASVIENDTLFIVIGDHGMTSTGDHGGASMNEVTTALFVYNPTLEISNSFSKSNFPVFQIDLVPTLSLLLGSPVPFSSIGKIIEDFFDSDAENGLNSSELFQALSLNVKQVSRYLDFYQGKYGDFPQNEWTQLLQLLSKMAHTNEASFKKLAFNYLNLAKLMCEEIWAKFDDSIMLSGIISLFCGIVLALTISFSKGNCIRLIIHLIILKISCFLPLSPFTSIFVAVVSIATLITSSKDYSTYRNSLLNITGVIILLFFAFASFSNSFIIVENYLTAFLLLSLILFLGLHLLINRYRYCANTKQKRAFALYGIILCGCLLVAFLSIRLSSIFWKCREEQYWCQVTPGVHTPLGGLPRESHNVRFFTAIIFLILIVILPRKWLAFCGNLNGVMPGVLMARFIPILNGVLIACFWALEGVQVPTKNILLASLYIPRVLYSLTFISFVCLFVNPLLIYIMPKDISPLSSTRLTSENLIPHIFMKLKREYSHRIESTPPVVYGLATGVSATFTFLIIEALLVLVIIAGDGMIISIFLLTLKSICCLFLIGLLGWKTFSYSSDLLLPPSFVSILLWFLLSFQGFFTTGHQATLSSIRWSAGFVGYDEAEAHWIPALLILTDTFSSQLLFGLSLPLVYIVPFTIGALWPSLVMDKGQSDEARRGEFILVERSKQARDSLTSAALTYVALHGMKVLLTCLASFILKRHLMTWKIFAPHFIFEGVGFLISCLGVLLGHLFILRTLSALESWSSTLCEKGE